MHTTFCSYWTHVIMYKYWKMFHERLTAIPFWKGLRLRIFVEPQINLLNTERLLTKYTLTLSNV